MDFEDYDIDHIVANEGKVYIFMYRWAKETAECEVVVHDKKTLSPVGNVIDLSKSGNSIRSHIIDGEYLYIAFARDDRGNDNSRISRMNLNTNEIE